MPYAVKRGFLRALAGAAGISLAAGLGATGPVRAEAALPVVELAVTHAAPDQWALHGVQGSTGQAGYASPTLAYPGAVKGLGALKAPPRYEPGFIVNKKHKLGPGYKPALKTIPRTSKKLTPDAVAAYEKMRKAAKKKGVHLTAISGYRSYARQKALFAQYSRQLGVKQASRISARPGTSEHQTGLAIDIGAASGRCVLSRCFANTREGKWLAKNAHSYGYILRYPRGGEKATGYDFEPWHFRYVGPRIAKDMKNKKAKTLEQYYSK